MNNFPRNSVFFASVIDELLAFGMGLLSLRCMCVVRKEVCHLQAGELLPEREIEVVVRYFLAQFLHVQDIELPGVQAAEEANAVNSEIE